MFGAGSWGTAFSLVLADAGNDVTMWARREEVCATINEQHENTDYLPGIELPARDLGDARPGGGRRRAPSSWCSPCPSQTLRENLGRVGAVLPPTRVLVSLMKGVELGTLKRMSEVIAEVTGAGPERIAVVSGPNLAQGDRPARAGRQRRRVRRRGGGRSGCSEACHSPAFRPYTQHRRARLRARRRLQERHRRSASAWPSASASATTPPPR